jgi:hypothetical protein
MNMNRWQRFLLLALGTFCVVQTSSRASDWPGWRGPTGLGSTEEKDLPLTWDGKPPVRLMANGVYGRNA